MSFLPFLYVPFAYLSHPPTSSCALAQSPTSWCWLVSRVVGCDRGVCTVKFRDSGCGCDGCKRVTLQGAKSSLDQGCLVFFRATRGRINNNNTAVTYVADKARLFPHDPRRALALCDRNSETVTRYLACRSLAAMTTVWLLHRDRTDGVRAGNSRFQDEVQLRACLNRGTRLAGGN